MAVDLETTFCGGDAWLNKKILLAGGNNLEGSYYFSSGDIYSNTPEAKHFVELYDMSNDPNAEPASVHAYDAMIVLTEALKRGGRSAKEIRDIIYTLVDFPLVSGRVTFNLGTGLKKSLYLNRIVRKGDDFETEVIAEIPAG